MEQAQALKDILETVVFIKDHAASKEDLNRFATKADLAAFELRVTTKEDLEAFASKKDLEVMKDDIMTHLDGLKSCSTRNSRRSSLRYRRTTIGSTGMCSRSRSTSTFGSKVPDYAEMWNT